MNAQPQSTSERWAQALSVPEGGPAWLQQLRTRAADAFRRDGLPHRKVEAWKYTPVQLLEQLDLVAAPADATVSGASAPLCERAARVDIAGGNLVGAWPGLPEGVTALPLQAGLERFGERLRGLFESVPTDGPARAFAALNTALVSEGLVIHVAERADAGRVLLRWLPGSASASTLASFRVVLLLEAGARLELLEQFQGEVEAAGGLNAMLQAELAERAELRHLRFQAGSAESVLLTDSTVTQAAESHYQYRAFDIGGRLARHELSVRLAGSEAEADLAGALVLDGQRYADHHVAVEHRAPGCRSEQFFRGVLGGRSRGVFNGRALIAAGADGSSVRQSNANLLLSPLAEMDTKPELEIYADEVEASHGATVGQLDENAVFYLRSRGLSDSAARRLLTAAFCHAVTERLEDRELAARIAESLDAAMPESGLQEAGQ